MADIPDSLFDVKKLIFCTLEIQSLIWYKIKFAFYSGEEQNHAIIGI
jgi:hypothetical protein